MELVFRNLISNAIKHNDKTDACISVSSRTAGKFIAFSVTENGPGIPEEHRERVFDMFQTLKPRDEVEGSGIGLALVRKTVESLEGTVTLESSRDNGWASSKKNICMNKDEISASNRDHHAARICET